MYSGAIYNGELQSKEQSCSKLEKITKDKEYWRTKLREVKGRI